MEVPKNTHSELNDIQVLPAGRFAPPLPSRAHKAPNCHCCQLPTLQRLRVAWGWNGPLQANLNIFPFPVQRPASRGKVASFPSLRDCSKWDRTPCPCVPASGGSPEVEATGEGGLNTTEKGLKCSLCSKKLVEAVPVSLVPLSLVPAWCWLPGATEGLLLGTSRFGGTSPCPV